MRSHEDLRAWQAANRLALDLHRFVDTRWSPARSTTFDQVRRASLSVPLNIAEGFASGPGGRCRYHLKVAYASAVETTAIIKFLMELGDNMGSLLKQSQRSEQMVNRLWRSTPR